MKISHEQVRTWARIQLSWREDKALQSGKLQSQRKETDHKGKKNVAVKGGAMRGSAKGTLKTAAQRLCKLSLSLYESDKGQEGLVFDWSEWKMHLLSVSKGMPLLLQHVLLVHTSLSSSANSQQTEVWGTLSRLMSEVCHEAHVRGMPWNTVHLIPSDLIVKVGLGVTHASVFADPIKQTKVTKAWNSINLYFLSVIWQVGTSSLRGSFYEDKAFPNPVHFPKTNNHEGALHSEIQPKRML